MIKTFTDQSVWISLLTAQWFPCLNTTNAACSWWNYYIEITWFDNSTSLLQIRIAVLCPVWIQFKFRNLNWNLQGILNSVLNGTWLMKWSNTENWYFVSFSQQIKKADREMEDDSRSSIVWTEGLRRVTSNSALSALNWMKKGRGRKANRETVGHRLDWFPAWGHARDRFSRPRFRKQEWPQSHSKRRSKGQPFDDLPEIQRADGDIQPWAEIDVSS